MAFPIVRKYNAFGLLLPFKGDSSCRANLFRWSTEFTPSNAWRSNIREEDVAHVVSSGKTIEDYPNDLPYPSRLLLGWVGSRPLHVVAAIAEHEIIVVTAYEPDPAQWQPGFEKRKS